MSELYDDDPRTERAQRPSGSRSRALIITGAVIVVAFFALTSFASFYTDRLWFGNVGYTGVFTRLLWTRIGLFVFFGIVMAAVVGLNIYLAYRYRPLFSAPSSEQSGLDRYREVVTPIRTWLLAGSVLLIGLFAGTSGAAQWRTFMLWRNGVPFGRQDVYFKKDIGFYVFDLPWFHYLTDFVLAASVLALIAAALVHYLYGGIRLQTPGDRLSGAAQVQLSALLGVFVLAKAVDYWLDRYDLTHDASGLLTGIKATDQQAVLPAKGILMGIAVICAILFFVNIWRRTWLLPSVGIALLALSAVLLGVIWPGIVQQFQVKPSEPNKEAPYIEKNIEATRAAYLLENVQTVTYGNLTGSGSTEATALQGSTATTPVIDPKLVRETFNQNQQGRAYYSVAPVLDVDRYDFGGAERPVVLGARELDQTGINPSDRNWSNLHTVYTHGSGLIAAYANQVTAAGDDDQAGAGTSNGDSGDGIVWAEGNETGQDALSGATGGFEDRIYFGEKSLDYSVVGKAATNDPDAELDLSSTASTDDADTSDDTKTTYDGSGGVDVGSTFRKLLYAVKFGEPNFLLSSRVNDNSKVLYDRTPRERVEKVAPWLTVDSDAYPAVVDGRVQWILDGYTTTDQYPGAERESFRTMTDDSLTSSATGIRTLPTDEINYMRNAVKATVDAYDGTVKLYAWDEDDPILKTWDSAFPGTILPRSSIPDALLEHLRYPEDLFKVQRFQLARYHVTDPGLWYQGSDLWAVPDDPTVSGQKQPPYRLFVDQTTGEPTSDATQASDQTAAESTAEAAANEAWSLTSVFVPRAKGNLASFVSVNSDATSPDYGKMRVLEVADDGTPGPGLISNELQSAEAVRTELLSFQSGQSPPQFGNLLTLPTQSGLVYIQPVYAQRQASTSAYPILRFVLTSYGGSVGIGQTLAQALGQSLGIEDLPSPTPTPPDTGGAPTTPTPTPTSPGSIVDQIGQKLADADAAFAAADTALAAQDLATYQEQVDLAQSLIDDALALDAQRGGGNGAGNGSGSTTPADPSATPSP